MEQIYPNRTVCDSNRVTNVLGSERPQKPSSDSEASDLKKVTGCNTVPEVGDITFQALSWYEDDFETDHDEEIRKEYQIYVHGVTQEGHSVCLRIMKFVPYFYILIPNKFQSNWDENKSKILYEYLKKRLGRFSYGLVSYKLVRKIKLYPFENQRKRKFIRLCFTTDEARNQCVRTFYNDITINSISYYPLKFELYESNVQSMLRFAHVKNILMSGWIQLKKDTYTFEDDDISSANIVITANWRDVLPYDCNEIAPFIVMSYDLECNSSRGYPNFPEAEIKDDFISQIGVAFWEFGEDTKKHQVVFTCIESETKSKELGEGVIVVNCKSEKQLLKRFCNMVQREDPDIITGYNTWGFDDKYLWTRLGMHNLDTHMAKLCRIKSLMPELLTKKLVSGAYGHNEFSILYMYGRETFDVIVAVRRENKLDSYKLDAVSNHFLKMNKVDISIRMGIDTEDTPPDQKTNAYQVLFEILERKDPKELAIVCDYCAHDSLLPILIIERLCFVPNFIEMSKSTRVPVDWLLLRGQQCKVFSQLVYEARLRDFVVPHNRAKKGEVKQKFTGATVLSAKKGAYFDCVAGLDFKSLYPSIMIAYNMCYSTIVTDEKYMNLDGVEYETVAWYDEKTGENFAFTFVQNIKGVLPDILERLWAERNATKREMKKYKGQFKAKVLNGKQLAIKVTMNSIYGFTGAGNGMMPCKPIAASVTAKGRQMIAHTSKLAEELYPCVTTYGDSVPGYQKVVIKNGDTITKLPIQELYEMLDDEWDYTSGGRDKKHKFIHNDTLTMTHEGWKKLARVIKHKCKKKMYKITTDKGVVTVTEDHSLFNKHGKPVKPGILKKGDTLMWKEIR